jgi:hypothetical protein
MWFVGLIKGKYGKRTVFAVSTSNAAWVKEFSAIPGESEWVLLPGMALTITGVSVELGEDLTMVKLSSIRFCVDLSPPSPTPPTSAPHWRLFKQITCEDNVDAPCSIDGWVRNRVSR